MENSDRYEQVLTKKSTDGLRNLISQFGNILVLAPVGLKSTRDVRDEPESLKRKGPDGTDANLNYEKGELVPARHDELGKKPDDDVATQYDKEVKKATRDRNIAASEVYRLEVETAQLVRNVESMLSFNRSLKEAWLFGKLDTLGQSSAEKQAEEHARVVAELLPKVINNAGSKSNGQT